MQRIYIFIKYFVFVLWRIYLHLYIFEFIICLGVFVIPVDFKLISQRNFRLIGIYVHTWCEDYDVFFIKNLGIHFTLINS